MQLRRGLGGATDWRSVAAQVIGTDPAVTSTDVKVELLTNAVAFDGGNLAAYAGLIALGYRRQGTDLDYDARLVDLLDRIAARADRHDDLVAIRLRTLFNLSVIRLNRAITHPDLAPTALVAADASATRLAALLDDVRDRRELAQLVAEIGTATWLLRASIHALDSGFDPPEGDEPTAAMSLLAYYERACLRMLEGRVDAALDDLFLATRGVTMRTAARTDRSFAELHDQQVASPEHARRFKMLVGDPVPADLFDLAPVKRHRKALERNGIRTADQLGLATVHRLVDEVGLGPGEARMLQELAMLFGVVKDAGLLFVLLRLGLATRADLRRRLASGADLRTELIAAAVTTRWWRRRTGRSPSGERKLSSRRRSPCGVRCLSGEHCAATTTFEGQAMSTVLHPTKRRDWAPHPAFHAISERRAADVQLRVADAITKFAGSMMFVYIHAVLFAVWMLVLEKSPWPTLTLIVSLEAIFLSTFVMIGQNRQATFQQAKAEHDFNMSERELHDNTELTKAIHDLTAQIHARVVTDK